MADQPPDTRVPDTHEDFENESQRNAGEQTDSQTAWEVNRKRRECIRQALEDERNGVGTKFNGEFLANMRARHPEEVQELSA
jgi:hypothetical protein